MIKLLPKLSACGLVIFSLAFSDASAGDNSLQQVSFQSVLELPSDSPDNSYNYGSHSSQFIQYWKAPKQSDAAANVIFIHGGCWLKEYDITHTNPASSAMRTAGFNVWSVEYRRLGEQGGEWPASLNDVKTAYTSEDDYRAASPKTKKLHANTWLMQGTDDQIVPMSQTADLDVKTEQLEGAGHFDLIHPNSTAWEAIIQRLNKELKP